MSSICPCPLPARGRAEHHQQRLADAHGPPRQDQGPPATGGACFEATPHLRLGLCGAWPHDGRAARRDATATLFSRNRDSFRAQQKCFPTHTTLPCTLGINRKVQMKPLEFYPAQKNGARRVKLARLVVKWGGELTPRGLFLSERVRGRCRCLGVGLCSWVAPAHVSGAFAGLHSTFLCVAQTSPCALHPGGPTLPGANVPVGP